MAAPAHYTVVASCPWNGDNMVNANDIAAVYPYKQWANPAINPGT